jgi:hypothetical protein
MTDEDLIAMLAITARLACGRTTTGQLGALSDSNDLAAGLPGWFQRDRRATAYAEAFALVGDATGDPVLMRLRVWLLGRCMTW